MSDESRLLAPSAPATNVPPATDPYSIRARRGESKFAATTEAFDSATASLVRPTREEVVIVPGYQILGELGRGGMGLVLQGRDPKLGREVAIKVLLESHRDRPELAQRFVEEAQINGQLQHPGVVPVYELGKFADERPYFAMKLVEGRTLAELLKDRNDPADDRPRFIKIFEQVCQTLAYAHARRVIHRDLKPANIMVGAFGEVQVMDWGLGKVLAADVGDRCGDARVSPLHTLRSSRSDEAFSTQGGVGTPAYMPPEQALGEVERVDERADVFGLGAILCEILTGRPPLMQLRYEPRPDEPHADVSDAFARLEACGADAELTTLAKGCLALDPADRPRDAGIVAAAVTVYLESVEARLRQSELDRAAAQVQAREERKRRKLTLGLATAVVVVFALIGGGLVWLLSQRGETERNVTLALGKAEQLQGQAEHMPQATSQQAQAALTIGNQANAAVEQAEGVLQSGIGGQGLRDAVATARNDVEQLLTSLEQQQAQLLREETLLRDLDAARTARMTWIQPATLTNAEIDGQVRPQVSKQTGNFNYAGSAAKYAAALAGFGLPWEGETQHDFRARILQQKPNVRRALVAALDDWTYVAAILKRQGKPTAPSALALSLLAADIDDDAWSKGRRQAASDGDLEQLKASAVDSQRRQVPPSALELLSLNLKFFGLRDDAIKFLRQARQNHPEDYWLQLGLGNILLEEIGGAAAVGVEECVGCYRTAVALRPDSAVAHYNLAGALELRQDVEEAVASYRRAIKLDPEFAEAHYNLGLALASHGDLSGAAAEFKLAIAANPHDAEAHTNLGFTLASMNDLDGAIAAYRRALEADPGYSRAYNNLGLALAATNDPEAAVAAYRKSLELDPGYANGHYNLGITLQTTGDVDAAIASYGKALELQPRFAEALTNLGVALLDKQDPAGAIAAFRKAIEINPRLAQAHTHLGIALASNNDLDGAIVAFQSVTEINPRVAEAHVNLGLALAAKNDLDGAIKAYQTAIDIEPQNPRFHGALGSALANDGQFVAARESSQRFVDLLPTDDPLRPAALAQLAACERFVKAEAMLPNVLAGQAQPRDDEQLRDLAQVCVMSRRYVAAVRFHAQIFAASPELADDLSVSHRYAAASCAALAARGSGVDAGQLTGDERAALRKHAIDWLRADLAAWTERLTSNDEKDRVLVEGKMEQWQSNPDLAGIRDAEQIENLPEEERQSCNQLWMDVEALAQRASPGPRP